MHRAAQLAVAAGDEGALRRHGDDAPEARMVEVCLGDGGLIERDRPLDGDLGVGEVHERVGPFQLQRPVGVHQVGVGGAVLQRLEGVAHAARDEDGLGGVQHVRVDLAEGGAALAQVHPGAEDAAERHGDELVPGLRVDAAGAPRCGTSGCGLLALGPVPGLGGLLGRAPPGLVGDVPVDGGLEALGEVGVGRPPAELALELRRFDGVAAVVSGAAGGQVEVLGVAVHGLEVHVQDDDVVPTARRQDIALLIAIYYFLQPYNKESLLHSSVHFDIEAKRCTRQIVAITKGFQLSYIKKLLKTQIQRLIHNQIKW